MSISIPYIFFNNLKATLCNISGIVTFGITTVVNIFFTAFVLGIHIKKALETGHDVVFIFQHTLPHFAEYIAIFISGYLGLSVYEFLFDNGLNKKKLINKGILLLIAILLLMIASIMEVKIAAI